MAANWPTFLRPTRPLIRFILQNPSRSGGVALNGMEQTVSSGAERWRASGAFLCYGKDAVLQFERFLTEMLGRSGEVNVPTFSGYHANWPNEYVGGDVTKPTGRVLHPGITRRKSLDGTAFEDPEVPTASEIIATAGSASLAATSIVITVTQGRAIRIGQLFGIGSRLYRAYAVTTPVAGAQTVDFRPKLRIAVTAGATVRFSRPVCVMKFASDDEGSELDPFFGGPVVLNFVEAF